LEKGEWISKSRGEKAYVSNGFWRMSLTAKWIIGNMPIISIGCLLKHGW
jgi:hypothetical protein